MALMLNCLIGSIKLAFYSFFEQYSVSIISFLLAVVVVTTAVVVVVASFFSLSF